MSDFFTPALIKNLVARRTEENANKFIVDNKHPEEAKARESTAQLFSKQNNIQYEDAYANADVHRQEFFDTVINLDENDGSVISQHKDTLIKGLNTKTHSGFLEGLKTTARDILENWRAGVQDNDIANLGAMIMWQEERGVDTGYLWDDVKKMQASQLNLDALPNLSDPDFLREVVFSPKNWVKGAARLYPMMLATYGETALYGLAGGLGGSLVGTSVPGVGTTAGFIGGFGFAMGTGVYVVSARKEAGRAYVEYRDGGASHKQALWPSLAYGAIAAGIETITMKQVMSTIPGMKSLLRGVAKETAEKIVYPTLRKQILGNVGKTVGKVAIFGALQSGEETAQEFAFIIGDEMWKAAANKYGADLPRREFEDYVNELVTTAAQTLGPMMLTGAYGTTASTIKNSARQLTHQQKKEKFYAESPEVTEDIINLMSLSIREVKQDNLDEWYQIQNDLAGSMALHPKIPVIIHEPDEMLHKLEKKIAMTEEILSGRKKTKNINPVNLAEMEQWLDFLKEKRDRIYEITEPTFSGVMDLESDMVSAEYSSGIEFQQGVDEERHIDRSAQTYQDPFVSRDQLIVDPEAPYKDIKPQLFSEQPNAVKWLNNFVIEYGDKMKPYVSKAMKEAVADLGLNVDKESDVYFTELMEEVERLEEDIILEQQKVGQLAAEGKDYKNAVKILQEKHDYLNNKRLASTMIFEMWHNAKRYVVSSEQRMKYQAEALAKANKFKARLMSPEFKALRGTPNFMAQVMESDTPNIDYYDRAIRKAFRRIPQEEIDLSYAVAQGIAEYSGISLEKMLEGFKGARRIDPSVSRARQIGAEIYVGLWQKEFALFGTSDSHLLSLLHEWSHYLAMHLSQEHQNKFETLLGEEFYEYEPFARLFEWWVLMGQIEDTALSNVEEWRNKMVEEIKKEGKHSEKLAEIMSETIDMDRKVINEAFKLFEEIFKKDDIDIGEFDLASIMPEEEMELFMQLQKDIDDILPEVDYTNEAARVDAVQKELDYWYRHKQEVQRRVDALRPEQYKSQNEETIQKVRDLENENFRADERIFYYETYLRLFSAGIAFQAGKTQGTLTVYDHGHVSRIYQGLRNRLKAHVINISKGINYKIAEETEMYHKLLIEAIQAKFNPTMKKNIDVIKNIESEMEDMNFFEKLDIFETMQKEIGQITLNEMENLRGVVDMLRLSGQIVFQERNIEVQQGADLVSTAMIATLLKGDQLLRQADVDALDPGVAATPRGMKATYFNAQTFFGRPADIFDSIDGARGTYDGIAHKAFMTVAGEQKDFAERIQKTRIDEVRAVFEQLGIKDEDFFESITVHGKNYTIQQYMTIYLGSKTDQMKFRLNDGNNVPRIIIENINDILPEKYRQAADEIAKNYREAWPRGRTASIEMFGKDMGYIDIYFPALVQAKPGEDIEFGDYFQSLSQEHAKYQDSFRYKRTGSGGISLDLVSNFYDIVPKFERFVGTVQSVKIMKKVMQNEQVVDALRQKRGPAYVKAVNDYIDVYINPSVYRTFGWGENLARKAKKHAAIAQLALNMSVILKQAPSMLLYFQEAGPVSFGAAAKEFMKDPKALIDKVKGLDPYMEFQVHERQMLEFKTMSPSKFKNKFNKAQRALMTPISWVDTSVKTIGWYALYTQGIEKLDLSPQDAIRRARDITKREQPSGDPTTLPKMYRSSEFLNLAAMYTNQTTKLFAMAYYQVPALMKSKNAKQAWMKLGAMYATTSMIWMISNVRVPKDLDDVIEILAGPLGWIPFIGRKLTAELEGYYSSGSPVYGSVTSLARSAKSLVKGDYEKALKSYAESMALIIGLPFAPVKKIDRAIKTGDWWNLINRTEEKGKSKKISGLSPG